MTNNGTLILIVVIISIFTFMHLFSIIIWINARVVGLKIPLFKMLMMKIRKSPIIEIVDCAIMIQKADIQDVSIEQMEAQALAGGNIKNIAYALVIASKNNIALSFQIASAIDLAGRNVFLEAQELAKSKPTGVSIRMNF
ncbi:MAG: flotillin-like FloA family protein [Paludibacter sp.]|jgi:uncharacterized protein YqfA (UPF0365 family)|nr:flotillin-like FloA family protein [Paludibacter sp.]